MPGILSLGPMSTPDTQHQPDCRLGISSAPGVYGMRPKSSTGGIAKDKTPPLIWMMVPLLTLMPTLQRRSCPQRAAQPDTLQCLCRPRSLATQTVPPSIGHPACAASALPVGLFNPSLPPGWPVDQSFAEDCHILQVLEEGL